MPLRNCTFRTRGLPALRYPSFPLLLTTILHPSTDRTQAFERNYECMGVTCEDVGGLVDENGDFYPGTEACGLATCGDKDGDGPMEEPVSAGVGKSR